MYTTLTLISIHFSSVKMSAKTRLILGNQYELELICKRKVNVCRLLKGIMTETNQKNMNFNEGRRLTSSHEHYAMYIPYNSSIYIQMGIKRKYTCIYSTYQTKLTPEETPT